MSDSISPYALLCASKPKPHPTVVTPYDLYSAVHSAQSSTAPTTPSSELHSPTLHTESLTEPRPLERISSLSQGRTHYIQDIHARHNQAARRNAPTVKRP